MRPPLQEQNSSDSVNTKTAAMGRQEHRTEDNRPTTLVQCQLAEMANSAPRLSRQRALIHSIHDSPRMVAQRHQAEAIFGGADRSQGDSPRDATLQTRQCMADDSSRVKNDFNRTGLPDELRLGIESLSGMDMGHVRVHYNSAVPAQLQAHAFAQGSEIHLGPGSEKHLPHEAWHVVQQAQGRVRPTMQMKGTVPINDDAGLEKEADHMGQKALLAGAGAGMQPLQRAGGTVAIVQLVKIFGFECDSLVDIKWALDWSPNFGIQKRLARDDILPLITELKSRVDCVDILEQLNEMWEQGSNKDEAKEGDDSGSELGSALPPSLEELAPQPKRQKPEDFNWKGFPDTYEGLSKIGVHETSSENLAALVATGPSEKKVGSGNGIGKGRGFYVTRVGRKELSNATKAIHYGERYVAVYAPSSFEAVKSFDEATNNTSELDKDYGHIYCYYVMSGGSEIIIPERCFPYIKVVSLLDELHRIKRQKPSALTQAIYEEEVRFATRMNELTEDYNNATSARAKASIEKNWNTQERLLFSRWSANSKQYTLWMNAAKVGQYVRLPTTPNEWAPAADVQ